MILTKETSLIFAVIFVMCYFLNILRKNSESRFSFKNFLLVVAPILVYSCFLIMHKVKFGVFFYSEHIGYINYDVGIVSKKNWECIYHCIYSLWKDGDIVGYFGITCFSSCEKGQDQEQQRIGVFGSFNFCIPFVFEHKLLFATIHIKPYGFANHRFLNTFQSVADTFNV